MPVRILLVGAGSIGAFFGSRLATVSNVLVSALCRSNYDAVKSSGFRITSPKYGDSTFKPHHTFRSPDEAQASKLTWDFLLVATKALPDVSDDSSLLEGLVKENTTIVLIQNGIGIETPYQKRFPKATILTVVTIVSVAQPSPGAIKHNLWTKTSVGPYLPHVDFDGKGRGEREGVATERTSKFVELLKAGAMTDTEMYDHDGIQFIRWHKIAINSAMNPSSVLSGGCGNRELALDDELTEHIKGVMNEVLETAPRILGKPFPLEALKLATPEQVLASVRKNTTGSRPSMWHDWTKGSKMELEVILGNPIRIARGKGLDMPRLQSMYALLRKAQAMRDESVETGKL